MNRILGKVDHSTVIATLALFVALGGTAFAAATITGKDIKRGTITAKNVKKKTLTGKQVKADSLTGKQVKESTLGEVPAARNAMQLGGQPAAAYRPEPVRVIGAAGQPAFAPGWGPAGGTVAPGFYKDASGIVHLQGAVANGAAANGSVIFTLPAGYRPGGDYADFVTAGLVNKHVWIDIDSDGDVRFHAGTGDNLYVSLEGITFRPQN